MSELWARERAAERVWVFSPTLYHDLFNPDCRRAVERNRVRGTEYRYATLETEVVKSRIDIYSKKFRIGSRGLEDEFLSISGDHDDLSEFLMEIVVYDPHSPGSVAYGYHPTSHHRDDDIVAFSSNVSQHFITHFQQLWADGKGVAP